jgi:GNAT superfamily N-acetyltransferase
VSAGFELRPFDPARIGEVVALWNAAAGHSFPLREALFRQNTVRDPHFDPAGAALACEPATGRVVGCGIAKVARVPIGADGLLPDRGWVSFVAVHPSRQRHGIGSALLRAGEAFLRAKARPAAVLGTDPGHFFPGVPDATGASGFFEALGYTLRGEAYDLHRSLRGYGTPEAVTAALWGNPDTEIRPLVRGEESALLAFLDATFPGRWRYTVAQFLDGGGAIGDVMGVVRGRAVAGFALLYHPQSRQIGPSIAWSPPPPEGVAGGRAGGLGPMGLSAALRGRGLGLALLDRAIVHLASRGVDEMGIDWTILLDFYAKLGFTPRRRYWHGERAL